MRANNLKLNEHAHLSDQVAQFLAQGGAIESVPTNIYKHEELTQTAKRTMLETSVARLKEKTKKESGHSMREMDRISWIARQMAGKA
jgi:hypothetical protein